MYTNSSKSKTPQRKLQRRHTQVNQKRNENSDIAGSKTISEKEWKKVLQAFKLQRKTDDK